MRAVEVNEHCRRQVDDMLLEACRPPGLNRVMRIARAMEGGEGKK